MQKSKPDLETDSVGTIADRQLAGDWILRIEVSHRDRLLARLDGVYASRAQAMAAVSATLADMDWSNILDVHGQPSLRDAEFRLINGATLNFWCGPRKLS